MVVRRQSRLNKQVAQLAGKLRAQVLELGKLPLPPSLVWITVPDTAIETVASRLASQQDWKGRVVFHSSGALTSDALQCLRGRGASVASVHPGMTFANGTAPDLSDVPFGVEGDAIAVRLAKQIIRELGGTAVTIRKENKVLYHAFDAFASPLLVALMAVLEDVGEQAGISRQAVAEMAGPLLQQTLNNYLQHGTSRAFTGPFTRGDTTVIERHLDALQDVSHARDVYLALAKAALKNLPVKNRSRIRGLLNPTLSKRRAGWGTQ